MQWLTAKTFSSAIRVIASHYHAETGVSFCSIHLESNFYYVANPVFLCETKMQ